METNQMQAYAKFSIAMRKAGSPVDLLKFAKDDEYALQVLSAGLNSTDQELVQLALEAGDHRNVLNNRASNTKAASPRVAGTASSLSSTPSSSKPPGDDDNNGGGGGSPSDPPKKRFIRSLR